MSFEPIEQFLIKEIQEKGLLSVSEFMEYVLGHPEHGYYMRQDPFGAAGDFTTAPEISQIFGDMIGLWLADIWMQFGKPSSFVLLECGPGRGTLMGDILRVTKNVVGFHDALEMHLLETSTVLQEKQKNALKEHSITWHETLETLPNGKPIFVVANEFLDALPIQQYEFRDNQWMERAIDYKDQKFQFVLRNAEIEGQRNLTLPEEGKVLELSQERDGFMKELSSIIKQNTGAALIFDYGYFRSGYGNTFQAVYKHKFVDPLSHIGEADLTAHVNFGNMKDICMSNDMYVFGMATQGDYLKKLGIQIHTSKLQKNASEQQQETLQKALHRLTHSDEMGTLFKVIGFGYGPSINAAGF